MRENPQGADTTGHARALADDLSLMQTPDSRGTRRVWAGRFVDVRDVGYGFFI